MAKGTLFFLLILLLLATLLFGINLGKKLGVSQSTIIPTPNPTATVIPTVTPTLTATPSAAMKKTTGITTFSDKSCGFSFSYPGSFIKQKSTNQQTTILTDPNDTSATIAATCAASIPRPPVSSDKIESITVNGVNGLLYHDQNSDGSPRDEVIVKHPTTGMEIIIAGYGENFQQALSSFKFVQ